MMDIPSSVYRVQFNAQVPFKKIISLIPYFKKLGIEGIYGSPIFVSEHDHGYDVIDPLHINPALGSLEDFEEFMKLLKQNNMVFVLDVVPNHMGTKNNSWWMDVLEKGQESPYAEFFDIDWMPEKPSLRGKILLPFLHDFYGRVLHSKMIKLIWDQGFWITYQDHRYPISFFSYPDIIKTYLDQKEFSEAESKEWLECIDIAEFIEKVSLEQERHEKSLLQKERLQQLYERSPFIQKQIAKILESINLDENALDALLEKQHYQLSYWAVAGQEINYRRFFNINELVAIHIEKKSVFNTHHRWILNLVESGKVQGLRIDHPDGLYDPKKYFDRLQEKKPSFVIAEKILDFKEKLPDWNIQGTVGYDFLNILNGLFIEQKNEKKLTTIYEDFIDHHVDFEELLYNRKKWFITQAMSAEINSLGWRLDQLSEKNKDHRDFTQIDLTNALKEIVACFPVYRTYVSSEGICTNTDRNYIISAIEKAQLQSPDIDPSLFSYLRQLLLGEWKDPQLLDFVLRFQQLTGPVMAKGLEDSCFYIYNRLISLNEVGGNPQHFGISKTDFHNYNLEKLEKWPLGFLATSTHDTKCSEDVRHRINVLSEIPLKWQQMVNLWKQKNLKYKKILHHGLFPDENTEYYLYQMLLGLWPLEKERCLLLLHKVIREAGIYTSWRFPNLEYENIVKEFVDQILTISTDNEFLPSFEPFQKEISNYGLWNSLSSLILKVGSCGIVDIYQGNEWENFRMMDPDNRLPVDYDHKSSLKFHLTSLCMNFRKEHKDLFLKGVYIPLKIQGSRQEEAVAFLRSYDNQYALIAAGRFFTHFSDFPLGDLWEDTFIEISQKHIPYKILTDLLTQQSHHLHKSGTEYRIFLKELFQKYPFSICT